MYRQIIAFITTILMGVFNVSAGEVTIEQFQQMIPKEVSEQVGICADETVLNVAKEEVAEVVEESPKNFEFVVSFTGDMLLASFKNQTKSGNFNDYVNNNAPTYFLEKVKPIFEDDDYTVVNLETVLTDKNLSPTYKNYSPAYWYCSKTSNTDILTMSSVECVSLSNNHTGDYGEQGRLDTIEAVEKAGLLYGTNDKTFYIEKKGYRIAIICHGLWYEGQENAIINRIKDAEEQSDFQIVFYHGGTERVHEPEKWRIRASRKLVDNGADLVIGNHPHVLQPMENYNGADILYSMGNFCFGDGKKFENRTIVYKLKLIISNDNILESQTSEIIPCYCYTADTNNYQPGVIENEVEKQNVLDFMAWERKSPL